MSPYDDGWLMNMETDLQKSALFTSGENLTHHVMNFYGVPRFAQSTTIAVRMPESCDVLVYPSTEEPGTWKTQVHLRAADVTDPAGELSTFGSTWQSPHAPTLEDVAKQVIDMLAHEVREQLGLNPHHEVVVTMTILDQASR
jgi:hypothetical protein